MAADDFTVDYQADVAGVLTNTTVVIVRSSTRFTTKGLYFVPEPNPESQHIFVPWSRINRVDSGEDYAAQLGP